jgi:hypothetical protein
MSRPFLIQIFRSLSSNCVTLLNYPAYFYAYGLSHWGS